MTFKEWWMACSGSLNHEYDAYQKCWEEAQSQELQRCAALTARRLAWEADLARAEEAGHIKEFPEKNRQLPHG